MITCLLFIVVSISGSCFSQDTLLIEDGSIWFSKSSCSIDYRCYSNIDDIVAANCSDSLTITSIELRENVFENASQTFTECRVNRLSDYIRIKHEIYVSSVISSPILMSKEEMRSAIQEQNLRTIIIVLDSPKKGKQ
ncbi:MAG: hypothetical protein ACJAUD_001141 [Crocinitomicaceae bacterium]|jgi:hypothetical protein